VVDEQKLAKVRQQIDTIDNKLVELLNERARLALEAGFAKDGKDIRQPERESAVLYHVKKASKGPLSGEGMETIFNAIIHVCRTIQFNK
jgi:chorismate mutase / prephenate dehydratase